MRKKLLILWAMIFAVVIAGTSAVAYAESRGANVEKMPSFNVIESNAAKTDYNRTLEFLKNSAGDTEDKYGSQVRLSQEKLGREAATTTAGYKNQYPMDDVREIYSMAYIRNRIGTSGKIDEVKKPASYQFGIAAYAVAKLDWLSFNVKETSHIAKLSIDEGVYEYIVVIAYGKD